MAPIGAAGLVAAFVMIALMYRKEFGPSDAVVLECRRVRVNRILLWKSLVASGLMILFFFIGWPIAKVAIVAGAPILLLR